MRVADIDTACLSALLLRFGLRTINVELTAAIPGSYWGDSEAGLITTQLYFRADTPLQSVLHEACHFICMDTARRASLLRDAGGDYDEENAVCYLQILLSEYVPEFGRTRMLADMDAWGYTFRLGSARAWFEQEADAARQWLLNASLIDTAEQPTWCVRA
ncbi:MAG: hypothetical protein AB7F79_07240 [Steroidobacteraceae bacterium]